MPLYQYAVNATSLSLKLQPSLAAMMRALDGSHGAHGDVERECPAMWSGCLPLNRSSSLSSRRSAQRWRTVLSISMFEPAWYVQETLENALAHTEESTLIVLHLSADTQYSASGSSKKHLEWLSEQERIEVSCFRHHVEAYTGAVLLSQLSNLQWARCRGLLRAATHVVFQASNMWWWREGMEAAVRRRNSSTPRITSEAECTTYVQVHARRRDGTHQMCFPVESRGEMRTKEGFLTDKCHVPPYAGLNFTVVNKHEGSFYATQDVLAAMDAIFDLTREQKATAKLLHALKYQKCAGQDSYAIKPDLFSSVWQLEELMLQTWVASFGRQAASDVETARSLAVTLEKRESRKWDVNCSTFCHFLIHRRQNVSYVDHYAVKYHFLRNLDRSAPKVALADVLTSHAKAREKGVSDMMLPDSNVIVRNFLRTCLCGSVTKLQTV